MSLKEPMIRDTDAQVQEQPAPAVTAPRPTTPPKRGWAADLRSRLGVLGELFTFLWKVRLWWLIPMIVVLIIFVFIFVFGASSPFAPFIYTLH
jgi:hypothetical protein